MRKRESKGVASADLLLCFPSTNHLTLFTPKPVYSPARPAESRKHHRHNHHHPLVRNSSTRIGGGGQQASPLLWAKNRQIGMEMAEPTSPKVTCVGQIKVRHKAGACKSWQSVMEEIERIHESRKCKKKSTWVASLGFKKDAMQFLTCLRNIRFDFRCFRSIPESNIIATDEENDDDYIGHDRVEGGNDGGHESSRTISSKWFMVLQENQIDELCNEQEKENYKEKACTGDAAPSVPPSNALLLTRCRSAPAKSWLQERQEEAEKVEKDTKTEVKKRKNLKDLIEEEKKNMKKERLVEKRCNQEFYKISSEIAKETWVVGGTRNPLLSRSKSWK